MTSLGKTRTFFKKVPKVFEMAVAAQPTVCIFRPRGTTSADAQSTCFRQQACGIHSDDESTLTSIRNAQKQE